MVGFSGTPQGLADNRVRLEAGLGHYQRQDNRMACEG